MHGEQGFKAVHKTVHLVKFTLLNTTGYKVLYGAYLAPQQQNKLYNFRFVLMLVSIQLRNPATGSQKANTNPIFSLEISVLEYYTARISVHRVLSD